MLIATLHARYSIVSLLLSAASMSRLRSCPPIGSLIGDFWRVEGSQLALKLSRSLASARRLIALICG